MSLMERIRRIWKKWKVAIIPYLIFFGAILMPGDKGVWAIVGMILVVIYVWVLVFLAIWQVVKSVVGGVKRAKRSRVRVGVIKRKFYFDRGKLVIEKWLKTEKIV